MKDIVKAVRDLDVVVDMNDYLDDLRTMTKSNSINELKKPEKERRHPHTIAEHTAQGMAPEKALEIANFRPSAPIVDDPDKKLKFSLRKSDCRFDDVRIEVKSMAKDNGWFSVFQSQLDSIKKAVPHNDYFLIMISEKLEDLKYRVRPRFLVDASKIMWYIKPSQHNSGYYFNHKAACSDGCCVDFKELAHV